MTTARRSVPVFLVLILVVLAALPAAAGAATPDPQLELGPLNPAFVEALHDPVVGLGLGRLPSPVEVHLGTAVAARAARAALPPDVQSHRPGPRDLPRQGPGSV